MAILQKEPERGQFAHIVADAGRRLVSAVTVYEAAIVLLFRNGMEGVRDLFEYLDLIEAEFISFDIPQVHAATAAYVTFGKGNHPEARLNFCDCIAYALAKSLNVPLLFKGHDFRRTDVLICV